MKLSIAKDFSLYPDGRYRDDGDFCGEIFREEKLVPAFRDALEQNTTLEVSLDDVQILSTSFLAEAFGGLVTKMLEEGKNFDLIEKTIKITANAPDKQYFVGKTRSYIEEAAAKKKK